MSTVPPDSDLSSLPRKSWQSGIAPNFIGLFLWVAFYDQLGKRTLSTGGLGWSLLGAALGGLLCFLLLYLTPALGGLRTRRGFPRLAAGAFGESGAKWLPGLVVGLAQVAWFGVGIAYAADLSIRGLVAGRLLDPSALDRSFWGGLAWKSPVFLTTAVVWGYAVAVTSVWAVRPVSALMQVFPIFPATVLGGAMVWGMAGLSGYRPIGIDPVSASAVERPEIRAMLGMAQFVFGFFAVAAVGAADWGAVSNDARDVRLGGLVGVVAAPIVIAALALLTVAGALGRGTPAPALASALQAQERLRRDLSAAAGASILENDRREVLAAAGSNFTFVAAVQRGIGGRAAGAMLLVLALGSMAPAVYAARAFADRFSAPWPGLSRLRGTLLGATAALPLIALGVADHLEVLFEIVGAAVAPLIAAVAADALLASRRSEPVPPSPRPGWNIAGPIAWLFGLAAGMAPSLGKAAGSERLANLQPSSVLAFVVGFVVYTALPRFVGRR